jgi:hypothetical protein
MRRLVVMLAAAEAVLLVAAQADLTRRPAALVSGSKAKWRLVSLINIIGPVAYFLRGRRKVAVGSADQGEPGR